VKALAANPGPDGISLQEAVVATNNDPGIWNIQFAPALKGSSIVLDSGNIPGLSFLTGGNVTINGDIDGDGKPDITLTSHSGATTIFVLSGGNTLNGLALQNCGTCVQIQRPSAKYQLPPATGTTFSNITISNLVLSNIQTTGIAFSPDDTLSALVTGNTWDHMLITGNTITGSASGPILGIDLGLSDAGDTLQHTTIANNNIVLPKPEAGGIEMNLGSGLGSTNNQVLDTLIANNVISAPGSAAFGIRIATGVGSASANLVDGVRVIANQMVVSSAYQLGVGINVLSGDAASDDEYPYLRPIQYSENNVVRNIDILSNTVGEAACCGIDIQVACCGNANNTIDNLSILGNTVSGMELMAGSSGGFFSRPSTGNTLSNVLVRANTIHSIFLRPPSFTLDGAIQSAGIGVIAGWEEPGNSVNSISIANNDVDAAMIGIGIVAGWGGPLVPGDPRDPPSLASNNVVAHPQIFCNQVDQIPNPNVASTPETTGINVSAGVEVANGNLVLGARVENNLILGTLGDASFFPNLGTGTSGNSISVSKFFSNPR
jgi:hypothetical protein